MRKVKPMGATLQSDDGVNESILKVTTFKIWNKIGEEIWDVVNASSLTFLIQFRRFYR